MQNEIWKDFNIYQKTSKGIELIFRDKTNGGYKDITGWTIYFTVKESRNDSDDNAIIKKDITDHSDPINGKSLIELTVLDSNKTPNNYWYDIKYKDTNGGAGILFEGRMKVVKPVTTRG